VIRRNTVGAENQSIQNKSTNTVFEGDAEVTKGKASRIGIINADKSCSEGWPV